MRSAKPSSKRKPVVLVFGENLNDSAAISHLASFSNPKLKGRVRARPKPVSLTKDAGPPAVTRWLKDLLATVIATEAGGQPVAAVLVHRDSDDVDPDGKVEKALQVQIHELPGAVAVVPVQATESWWLLYPTAVESLSPLRWKGRLSRKSREVDLIPHPKDELKRATRPYEYSEADSRRIAERIASGAHEQCGTSGSFARFQARSREIDLRP